MVIGNVSAGREFQHLRLIKLPIVSVKSYDLDNQLIYEIL